jgi:hypothetical protein
MAKKKYDYVAYRAKDSVAFQDTNISKARKKYPKAEVVRHTKIKSYDDIVEVERRKKRR